ncbi:PGN_0703 family putative restriction endonuclease [Bradyrhizobium liaoningense]|uniref:PGN_0703 family putative restriction endonuclease n=1 Tax=Bradyrhizobium liaoningense TaxID=43992 RepID=UPI001BAA8DD4|nr:hypothetical protein [Bradyrhizobium liaoningense]MBR0854783.1 hypothetical protein [Bradyrhizobium liaoningense]
MSNTDAAAAPHSSNTKKQSRFAQLGRTPWIPERLLQEYGGLCSFDSNFRRASRFLQICWMRDHDIPNAVPDGQRNTHLGSYLSPDAADAGLNFISKAVHLLALRSMLLRERDAAYDFDRAVANALSSQPLVFNAFGPLALDIAFATKVCRQLLPSVESVEEVLFEHSPGRRVDDPSHDNLWLADRSAVDVALRVRMTDGEPGIVYCEVKYSEDQTGPAARWRERYDEALKQVRLYKNPDSPVLRDVAIEQLTREHMLSQLAVDNGVTSRAIFIAIGPQLNRRVQAAFRVYSNELLPVDDSDRSRVPFKHFTLEAFIDAIDVAGGQALADQLWQRYCNFHRVYEAALSFLAPNAQSVAGDSTTGEAQAHREQDSRPRSRRRSSARTKSDHTAGLGAICDDQ